MRRNRHNGLIAPSAVMVVGGPSIKLLRSLTDHLGKLR